MVNKDLNVHVAVISHGRPGNVHRIMEVIGCPATFYVNKGEGDEYLKQGHENVVECGDNICVARNYAIQDARDRNLPSIQVSDDLKGIKMVKMTNGKRAQSPISFASVVNTMVEKLKQTNFFYGGVAVTSNPLNFTGANFSFEKLIVCDLICMMPSKYLFDVNMALKEDYDMTIVQLLEVGGVVRCDNFLCDFPHRQNSGGANIYRNESTEAQATAKLLAKWPGLIKSHATRKGQISLNYPALNSRKKGQGELF